MERRERIPPWVWAGSTLIALLILATVGFGAYRLYAMGYARGIAAGDGGQLEAPDEAPTFPAPYYSGRRPLGTTLLLFVLALLLIGGALRHLAWRMHGPRRPWGHGHWAWHPYPGAARYPNAPGSGTGEPEPQAGGEA